MNQKYHGKALLDHTFSDINQHHFIKKTMPFFAYLIEIPVTIMVIVHSRFAAKQPHRDDLVVQMYPFQDAYKKEQNRLVPI